MKDRKIPGQRGAGSAGGVIMAILAASADGLLAVDDRGIVRLCNIAAEELLGRSPGELVGTRLDWDTVPGQACEIELTVADGTDRVLDVRATETIVDGERLRVAALRDVTHRRLSERALQAALERQSAALSVAAHELHSPLAAISVLADLLADRQLTMAQPERAKVAGRIAELASRLQVLMRRLLTSAQIEAGGSRAEPEQVSVLEVIIEQLAVAETEPGSITVRCSPGLTVVADRAEFAMMLANYIDNARAYATPPIEVRAAQRDGWAEIQVADHGPGVPESFAPRLFERFARAPQLRHKAEGVGLGLWIVRTFAQANGGDAWYQPGEHGGSSFLLRLPLVRCVPAGAR